MIISFYPGAGGNKYYQHTKQQEWQTFQKSYDLMVLDQQLKNRYPIASYATDVDSSGIILTHCLNSQLLRSIWPNHEITVIIADMQSSLRREWMLLGHQRYIVGVKHNNSRLELYHAIKDSSWPDVVCSSDLENLPATVMQELDCEWQKTNLEPADLDPISKLKKHYLDQIDSATSEIHWHRDYYQSYPVDLTHASKIINIEQDVSEFAQHMKQEMTYYSSELFDQCWKNCHV